MPKNNFCVVVLAAGLGTRMKSENPKVMHLFDGFSLIVRVLKKAVSVCPDSVIVITGHKGDIVKQEILRWKESSGIKTKIDFVSQKLLKGSGRAVFEASGEIAKHKHCIILSGDVPLIRKKTILDLKNKLLRADLDCAVLSCEVKDAKSYGRIIKNSNGSFKRIVESADAFGEELKVKEINSGVYAFKTKALLPALKKLAPKGLKKEYYLTDCIEHIINAGGFAGLLKINDELEISGVNSKKELCELYIKHNQRTLEALMDNGVHIIDPSNTYICDDTKIGKDTVIYPSSHICRSNIGERCFVGPSCVIEDSFIDSDTAVKPFSCIYSSKTEEMVSVGPFSHLRPDSFLKKKSKVGNFSEIKKSVIGEGSKVPHLSYVGDTFMGPKVNVGAGTITCNYDGKNKHKTDIEEGAFIGSNTNLVAPVKVGRNSLIAAGSTITENVPADSLALARARQIIKKKRSK